MEFASEPRRALARPAASTRRPLPGIDCGAGGGSGSARSEGGGSASRVPSPSRGDLGRERTLGGGHVVPRRRHEFPSAPKGCCTGNAL